MVVFSSTWIKKLGSWPPPEQKTERHRVENGWTPQKNGILFFKHWCFQGVAVLQFCWRLSCLKNLRGGSRGGDRCVRRCRGDPKWIQWPLFKFKWSVQYRLNPLDKYSLTWIKNLWNHHLDSPRILFRTPTDRIPNSSDSCGKTFVCHPLPDATNGSGSPTSKN